MSIPEDIALFEQGLSELIIKYEQYFLGLEKREPLKLLEHAEKLARKYQGFQIVNTMLKFRYNSAIARLNSYKQYWHRVNREIEEGKYSRDRFKMEMHQRSRPAGHQEQSPHEAPERQNAVSKEVETLYRALVEARRACRLTVDNISLEMVAAAINRQKPAILSKYNCKGVEFKVVIEDGQPKIKARPKM